MIPAQVSHSKRDPQSGQADALPLERWHVALTAGIAAELRGYAAALAMSHLHGDSQLSDVESVRADQWFDLSKRIAAYVMVDSDPTLFSAKDVELVRWYKLVQIRRLAAKESDKQKYDRARKADALFRGLYAVLVPMERERANRELGQ